MVDESVTRCISQIRKALGDARPYRYIETLPKRGYRLVATVGSC
ncbi:MAG: winged helix-turn-helix domain-containing protein [Gammaproteobacteria bacterium]|nr:winged helix-turn-helix domain-containing protein [Gammaproteobacteria bacterium]